MENEKKQWPTIWPVQFSKATEPIGLPLIVSPSGFGIYSFNLMGQARWNEIAAAALKEKLQAAATSFDIFLTAEAKAIGLTNELARLYRQEEYVVLRKSRKLYMNDPVELEVRSISTPTPQKFFLGRESFQLLQKKRVAVVDDVVSTGGTMNAFFELARQIDFEIVIIATVLTEETEWKAYNGAPVVSLDHIPLPGQIG